MDFIKRILPEDPIETHKYLSPSTCITLDNEISGILWICYYFIFISRLLPGGIQFEVHVDVEEEERLDDDDDVDTDGVDEETSDDEDGTRVNFDVRLNVVG